MLCGRLAGASTSTTDMVLLMGYSTCTRYEKQPNVHLTLYVSVSLCKFPKVKFCVESDIFYQTVLCKSKEERCLQFLSKVKVIDQIIVSAIICNQLELYLQVYITKFFFFYIFQSMNFFVTHGLGFSESI